MLHFYNKYKNHIEYIPFLLLSLIFLSHDDLHKHAIQNSFQIITVIITFVIFYFVFYKTNIKILALLIALIIWIIMIYLKKNYVFQQNDLFKENISQIINE